MKRQKGIEYSLSKFADMKLEGVVNTPEMPFNRTLIGWRIKQRETQ